MPIELTCTSCGKPYFSRTNDGSSLCPACRTAAFSADEPKPVPPALSTSDGGGTPETTSVKKVPFRRCLTFFTLTYFMFLGVGLVLLLDWQHPNLANLGILIWGVIAALYGLFHFALVRSAIARSTMDATPESPSFKILRRLATAIDETPDIPSIQKKPRSRLWLTYFVVLWLALFGAVGLHVAIVLVPKERPLTTAQINLIYSYLVFIGTFTALLWFPIVVMAFTARKLRGLAILFAIAGAVGLGVLIFFLCFFTLMAMSGPTR